MKSWPKVNLGQVKINSNIAQNYSSSTLEVISGHYLPQFTWKVDQKWNLCQVGVGPNIAHNHSSGP